MDTSAQKIHDALQIVPQLRRQHASEPALAQASIEVKRFQARRFQATYALHNRTSPLQIELPSFHNAGSTCPATSAQNILNFAMPCQQPMLEKFSGVRCVWRSEMTCAAFF